MRATKPAGFDLGAKAPLSLKKDRTMTAQPAPPTKSSWAVSAGDGDELMDDEELLTEEDKRPVNAASEWRSAIE